MTAIAKACGRVDCSAAPPETTTVGAATPTPSAQAKRGAIQPSRGVKDITQNNAGQYLITCTTRPSIRYWRQNREWNSQFGAVGLNGLSIQELAKRHCGR